MSEEETTLETAEEATPVEESAEAGSEGAE